MSPLNRGPLLGPRVPPAGIRPPPPPRFGGRLPPPRMPPPPMSPVFGPMRQMLPPPPRPGGIIRPNSVMPLFGPRGRGMAPMVPPMGMRGSGPRGPMMRPWPRRALPPPIMSHMRPRFAMGNGNIKGKAMNNTKKVSKLEELELKKPWMTDEIRSEIQKKNKLYAKAKKNKDAKEWEEFKDLRNKVTRMIRDAKNEYLAKHPEQAHLYPDNEDPYDQRDENYPSSDEESFYCEVCDREFQSEHLLATHKQEHKLCGIDGCTFSAHPLLVERHISMQHSTGLYQRMKNLSTPEDIEKWLAERKKKYPTKANIELRKAEDLGKVQRGEVIKQQKDLVKQRSKKVVNARDKKRRPVKRAKRFLESVQLSTEEKYRGVGVFPGTLNLEAEGSSDGEKSVEENVETVPMEETNCISDEDDVFVSKLECPQSKQVPDSNVPEKVSSLVANYGSDSDESGPETLPIKKMKTDEYENIVRDVEVVNATEDIKVDNKSKMKSVPVDLDKEKHVTESRSRKESKVKQRISNNRPPPERLQLLHRLLSRSIQHERNLICQCVKYIVDNNFFE